MVRVIFTISVARDVVSVDVTSLKAINKAYKEIICIRDKV